MTCQVVNIFRSQYFMHRLKMSLLAATTDMWPSYTTESYLSYTVHFVGEDWKLESRCLQAFYLPEDHTGENIAVALRETLESWEIDVSKHVCLTTDNGSNIHSMRYCKLSGLDTSILLWPQSLPCSSEFHQK